MKNYSLILLPLTVVTLAGLMTTNAQAYGLPNGWLCMTAPQGVTTYYGLNQLNKPDCGSYQDVHTIYTAHGSYKNCLVLRRKPVNGVDCESRYQNFKNAMRVYRGQVVYQPQGHMQ